MHVRLKTVVDYLDALGFECYWLGNAGGLWQITGCDTNVDYLGWSNVGCAKRGDVFADAMHQLARDNGGVAS